MGGTPTGGQAAYEANIRKNPNFYQEIGAKGGRAPTKTPKGFAGMPREKVQAAGKLGGTRSSRARWGDPTAPFKVRDTNS